MDTPYEHNAGTPYKEKGQEIVKISFNCDLITPDYGHHNSPWTVENINSGAVAWLRSLNWMKEVIVIQAGTGIQEFVDKVKESNGSVYMPPEWFFKTM